MFHHEGMLPESDEYFRFTRRMFTGCNVTYRRKTIYLANIWSEIKCRLDNWLIAHDLLQNSLVRKCEIKHASHCDHSSVTMELQINVKFPREPGLLKFDSSLLEDDKYKAKFHFINKYQDLEDKGLLWELVKMEIRAFTFNYSKQNARTLSGRSNTGGPKTGISGWKLSITSSCPEINQS